MIETSDEITPVYPAATVILMRDTEEGPEVLLVQRSKAVRHMGGQWVFPGGRVDPEDAPENGDSYLSAVNAAIRETREEAGLVIDADQLEYLSHWTTPEGAKKRFATWFFLAILEDDQEVEVDGGEIALHRWVSPAAALREIDDPDNPFNLMPPTFVSLVDLASHTSCAAARSTVRQRDALMYAPNMVFIEGGICFLYEGDAGYGTGDETASGPRHRTYMVNQRLEYIRDAQ
ncbi:NUDIX hydrolase [Parahaliea maris]|uniref:NUDIX hydrolase n=1 Tax=Parahaliea maris TaxID=2716870 RepID=A0A5C8ZUG1_9GAMM|nr:NUDIX hydrolase [Parahaliea maris]TXS92128.1 NUDIX hydrolase [Parahaliea maris]